MWFDFWTEEICNHMRFTVRSRTFTVMWWMNHQYGNHMEILMKEEQMINKLVTHLSLWIVLTNSSNKISVSHLIKLVDIFYSFVTPLSMKLSPFISSIEKFVWDRFLAGLVMNTEKSQWTGSVRIWCRNTKTYCIIQ